jgi:hypothetical protein
MARKEQQRNCVLCAVCAEGTAKQQLLRNRGTVFSVRSVPRCYKLDQYLLQLMTLTKDRSALSLERAPHNNKTVTVKQ